MYSTDFTPLQEVWFWPGASLSVMQRNVRSWADFVAEVVEFFDEQ